MNKMNTTLPHKQQGIALILTLVVLSVVTFLSVSAVDSSALQSIMARNNQFRLEVFNAANSELDAQIDSYVAEINAGPTPVLPEAVEYLATLGVSSYIWGQSGLELGEDSLLDDEDVNNTDAEKVLKDKTYNPSYAKGYKLTLEGTCPTFGASIGEVGSGETTAACFLLRLDSNAKLKNTNAVSNQAQTFQVRIAD